MTIEEIITKFREAGFSGRVYRNMEDAIKTLEASKPEKPVWCNYKGQLRQVHPKVCEWHQEEEDPECEGCRNRVLHYKGIMAGGTGD